MTTYDVKRLAEIFAIQAEVEGMKASNIERQSQGLALSYGEASFIQAAEQLRVAASKHDHQL